MRNRRMCFMLSFFLMILLHPPHVIGQTTAFPEPPVLFETPLSPRIANYNIDVRLEPERRLLHGKEVLVWKNTSTDEITELQFHLYLNAFRNSKSTFMLESGGVHRGNKLAADGWGYIEINRMVKLPSPESRVDLRRLQMGEQRSEDVEGEDLTPRMEFIHPDNPDHIYDKTVMRVRLSQPLPPGEQIALYFDFTSKLPQPPFARTGAKKEYFFVGQWFPKIGVYTQKGWNCHQFHLNSEFFADFGVYNVWITVPEKNIVGATGIQVGDPLPNGDGTATHYYHAEDVHDFAWTTSPEFKVFTGKVQDVDIRVLMQPDHKSQGPRHVEAAKTAVEYFQNWYGDYPFPNLTVVDPRRGAEGSSGMEYPTLITAGTTYGLPEGIRTVELVIIHEFGHNFWYHLLASNEFEESWMDEGINTYTEIQIMNDKYGPTGDAIDFMGININDQQFQRFQYILAPDVDPMLRNAWEYYSRTSYGVNSYSRPGIVLTTLQNYLGKETMRKIMQTYVERWRFKHPHSQDFVDIVNEVSGKNMQPFFDQVLYTNAVLDYSVDNIFTRKYDTGKGFDFNFDIQTSEPDTTGEDVPKDSVRIDTDTLLDTSAGIARQPELYYSGVNLRRRGDFVFPVELEVVFEDGEVIHEHWDGKELWKKFRYIKPTKLVSATIDPENKVVMDVNFTNNSKSMTGSSSGKNKLAIRWMFWMQYLLDQPEIMNWFTFMF